MDATTNLLADRGWEPAGTLRAQKGDAEGYDKPVFRRGAWKSLVGRVWVTLWRLASEGQIAEMESFRADDAGRLEAALDAVAAGRFVEFCGA